MRKLMLFAILWVACQSYSFSETGAGVIIGVTDFQVKIKNLPDDYGTTMATIFRSHLGQNRAVNIVERERLASILKELRILPEQLIDPATAVKLQGLQMNYLVFGAISRTIRDTIISARLIDIKKATVVAEYMVEYSIHRKDSDHMLELSNKIFADIEVETFSFEAPVPGQQCAPGSVTAYGQHALSADVMVWLVLKDDWAFYPQDAFLSFRRDGRWSCDGLKPGRGIRKVLAVLVNREGHEFLLDRVRRGDWGQFSPLPAGSRILSSVDIEVK